MWPAAAWSSLISRAARSPPGEGRVWMMRGKKAGLPVEEMADRLRGSHQRGQTTAWTGSQPVQGGYRYQALGRPRGDCRQPGQHQPRHGQAAQPIIPLPLTSHRAGGDLPAGPRAQIRCTVVKKQLFAPESSYHRGGKMRTDGNLGGTLT